jgi:hypothetical protein
MIATRSSSAKPVDRLRAAQATVALNLHLAQRLLPLKLAAGLEAGLAVEAPLGEL